MRSRHFYTTTAPSCCIPASYSHLSATFQTTSIIVVDLQDNRAVFRIFIALLKFLFDSPPLKPTRCTNVSNLFYFGMTLYMFRKVFLSISRSSRLYIQQQAFVKQIFLSACICQTDTAVCTQFSSPTKCTVLILYRH